MWFTMVLNYILWRKTVSAKNTRLLSCKAKSAEKGLLLLLVLIQCSVDQSKPFKKAEIHIIMTFCAILTRFLKKIFLLL
jgi:hypothetical protein